MSKIYSSKEIYLDKLRKFCAYQDRCQQEVMQKMRSMLIDFDWQDEIIISLIQEKYVDEERYAKSIVRGKFNQKSWGKNKITYFLKQHDITHSLIQAALKEIDEVEYLASLQKLVSKKMEENKNLDLSTNKNKIITYLLQKGYESELIYKVLNDYANSKK